MLNCFTKQNTQKKNYVYCIKGNKGLKYKSKNKKKTKNIKKENNKSVQNKTKKNNQTPLRNNDIIFRLEPSNNDLNFIF